MAQTTRLKARVSGRCIYVSLVFYFLFLIDMTFFSFYDGVVPTGHAEPIANLFHLLVAQQF